MDNNTVYEWILPQFTVSARFKGLQFVLSPHLSAFVQPGTHVLDICCGAGGMAFWFEEQGARVIGMDKATYMLSLAREEAYQRGSSVEFIEADIHEQDLGQERYELISCFGNSITDFPLSAFVRLGVKVARALKVGGRFIVQYHDGSYRFMQGEFLRDGVYQESPERITYHYKGYFPEIGAHVQLIQNETRGEEYQRTGYIYTVPIVQTVMNSALDLESHIILGENHFLDVFVKTIKSSK